MIAGNILFRMQSGIPCPLSLSTCGRTKSQMPAGAWLYTAKKLLVMKIWAEDFSLRIKGIRKHRWQIQDKVWVKNVIRSSCMRTSFVDFEPRYVIRLYRFSYPKWCLCFLIFCSISLFYRLCCIFHLHGYSLNIIVFHSSVCNGNDLEVESTLLSYNSVTSGSIL